MSSPERRWLTALLAGAGLACGESTEPNSPAGLQLLDVRLTPAVATRDESFTLSLRIEGAQEPVAIARLDPATAARLSHTGPDPELLVLRDDGGEGDAASRDGWFTVTGLRPAKVSGPFQTEHIAGLRGLYEPGSSDSRSLGLKLSLRMVDPDQVAVPTVTALEPGFQATSRVVAVAVPEWRLPTEANLEAVVRRYYSRFPDDRDFLAVEFPASVGPPWSGRAFHIRNRERGIGLPLREFRDFGSASRLQLVVQGAFSWFWSAFPGSGWFCLLNHELSHRWMAYTGEPLEAQAHWASGVLDRPTSVLGDSVGCVMNELELYLAGLLPADSILTPLTRSGFTIQNLVSLLGPRDADSAGYRRDFTIGFIVVSESPLSAVELAYYHHLAAEYADPAGSIPVNWAAATGGRSRLDGLLPSGK